LVDDFVFEAKSSDDAWTEKRILAKLGEKAYARALLVVHRPSDEFVLAHPPVAFPCPMHFFSYDP
jgi:hypothetical protein